MTFLESSTKTLNSKDVFMNNNHRLTHSFDWKISRLVKIQNKKNTYFLLTLSVSRKKVVKKNQRIPNRHRHFYINIMTTNLTRIMLAYLGLKRKTMINQMHKH